MSVSNSVSAMNFILSLLRFLSGMVKGVIFGSFVGRLKVNGWYIFICLVEGCFPIFLSPFRWYFSFG